MDYVRLNLRMVRQIKCYNYGGIYALKICRGSPSRSRLLVVQTFSLNLAKLYI